MLSSLNSSLNDVNSTLVGLNNEIVNTNTALNSGLAARQLIAKWGWTYLKANQNLSTSGTTINDMVFTAPVTAYYICKWHITIYNPSGSDVNFYYMATAYFQGNRKFYGVNYCDFDIVLMGNVTKGDSWSIKLSPNISGTYILGNNTSQSIMHWVGFPY